ncbi:MAG: aminofutalosine synthase MqnE [Nitrospirae bacterium]|nr:aminofutalosine synthase MqnE [Nitrospirota bacterium]
MLHSIEEKVDAGVRLTPHDALALFPCNDLLALGRLADKAAVRLNGNRAYFVRNRHINPTNVCVHRCTFCSYRRGLFDSDAYTLGLDEIMEKVEGAGPDVREFHVVGGLHPDLPFDYYLDILRRIRRARPGVHLKAYTAVEIDFFSKRFRLPLEEVILALKEAGMDSIPGGGAEIFAPAVREKICGEKIDGDRWIEVIETAHRLGIPSNATMLYGHLETNADRVDHLSKLRDLQDRTGGIMAFIPLAFHPENNRVGLTRFTSGLDDLRVLAVSRLFLDNVPHVKAYWVMLGEKMAQVALRFGADDIDGTVVEEKIYHAAGARERPEIPIERLVHLIRTAGKVPVERDTLYHELRIWN